MSRPEWSDVAIAADLTDLAVAFTLQSTRHYDAQGDDLLAAAAQTRLARYLHQLGIYDTDTATAWCIAGRAYLRLVLGPELADAGHEVLTTEGTSR